MAFSELHYWSESLQKHAAANIILPEAKGIQGPFPVFYLLHGLSDDHTAWQRFTSIERYVWKLPLIVVMPDGGRGFYCDAVQGYAYESAIMKDLIGFVDRTYNTKAERNGRVIAGLSMGGYGALKLALRYPAMFCSAVSHSGGVGFGHEPLREIRQEEFGPVLGADFVGGPNDLYALAEKVDRNLLPALRIDCGTEDFDFLIKWNRDLHTHFENIGLPHEYEEFPGGHDWSYWDRHVQDTIRFHCKHLGIEEVKPKS